MNWRHLLAAHDAATAEPKRWRKSDLRRPERSAHREARTRIGVLEKTLWRKRRRSSTPREVAAVLLDVLRSQQFAMSTVVWLVPAHRYRQARASLGIACATHHRQR